MKEAVQRIYKNPVYLKIFHWGKLLAITGGAQTIVQGVGLICGLLVIRLLPTQEYAWYTLANTMLGTMSVLADGGISTGVMALGGKVWQDKEKLGSVLVTGLDLRKKFAIVSLIIALPILVYLLLHHNANWLTTILITASLIPAFFAALSDSILEIIPKLKQDIISLQKNQITVSIGRLLLSTITLFIFPFTFVAIISAGIPRMYGNIKLSKLADKFANKQQLPNKEIRYNLLVIVKRILPGSVYYCLTGQITIWLISIFGETSSIAQVGALGRLVIMLSLFSILFHTLVVPRFSRLANDSKLLLNKFIMIHIALLIMCSLIIVTAFLYSTQILWLLGKDYSGLNWELVLSIIGGCISIISGISFTLCTSRGYIINPFLIIPINIITLCCAIYFLNISTLKGVLILNIIVAAVQGIIYILYGIFKILRVRT